MSEADDERAREREVILQRRARLVAYAVAAGVAAAACSGKTSSSVCLSIAGPQGGGTPVTMGGGRSCLSVAQGGYAGTVVSGGTGFCLSAPISGAGGITVCLEPPIVGGSPDPGIGGAGGGGESTAGGEGGATAGSGGSGGVPPVAGTTFCLAPPA